MTVSTEPSSPPVSTGPRSGQPKKYRRTPLTWVRGGGLMSLLFMLPMLVIFGLFSWWPIVRSMIMSLQQTNFIVTEWVGLDNFARVLADPLLGQAAWNTAQFTLWSVLLGFPLPVLMAVFVAELRRARPFASVLAYLPVIIPPVVAVLLWKNFYYPGANGLFNTMLGWVGLGPLNWLNDGNLVIPAIVLQMTWAAYGSSVIIYIATLMTIRTDLYEAAEVDGASILRRFWHVTLPQMRGILLIMLLLQLIGVFQTFTEPFLMTGGGPVNRSVTILMLIYRYAFVSGDYGRATALSLMLAGVLAVLSAVYLWVTRRWSNS